MRRSRWVCVAGGFIMVALGLVPKMAALVESGILLNALCAGLLSVFLNGLGSTDAARQGAAGSAAAMDHA